LKEKYEKSAAKIQENSSNLYAQFSIAFNSLKTRLNSKDSSGHQQSTSSADTENSERNVKSELIESENSYEGDTDIDTEGDD